MSVLVPGGTLALNRQRVTTLAWQQAAAVTFRGVFGTHPTTLHEDIMTVADTHLEYEITTAGATWADPITDYRADFITGLSVDRADGPNAFDTLLQPAIVNADVVRVSDTKVRILIDANASADFSSTGQVVSATVPSGAVVIDGAGAAAAVTGTVPIVGNLSSISGSNQEIRGPYSAQNMDIDGIFPVAFTKNVLIYINAFDPGQMQDINYRYVRLNIGGNFLEGDVDAAGGAEALTTGTLVVTHTTGESAVWPFAGVPKSAFGDGTNTVRFGLYLQRDYTHFTTGPKAGTYDITMSGYYLYVEPFDSPGWPDSPYELLMGTYPSTDSLFAVGGLLESWTLYPG